MILNVRETIKKEIDFDINIQISDITIETDNIQVLMINEVVPFDSELDFYGKKNKDGYLKTTLSLFESAGILIHSADELLSMGIYITNAVKIPKNNTTIEKEMIDKSLPFLEKEIDLFPNLKAIMLMGDVAKKMFNQIAKKKTGKTVIPSGSTYKLRNQSFFYGKIRVFPSYIMTGKNLLIEKSKFEMICEDIEKMEQSFL